MLEVQHARQPRYLILSDSAEGLQSQATATTQADATMAFSDLLDQAVEAGTLDGGYQSAEFGEAIIPLDSNEQEGPAEPGRIRLWVLDLEIASGIVGAR